MTRISNRYILVVRKALAAVGIATTLAGGALAQSPSPAPTPIPVAQVKLSAVPSSSSYNLGDSVVITLTLTNQSLTSLGLSSLVDGSVIVTSFTHNGGPIPTMATVTSYGDGFPAALAQSLRSVAAGSSLTYQWTSDFNQELGGQGLLRVRYSGDSEGAASYSSLAAPGTYSLTFYYQYSGPTNTFPGTVFLGKTNSVTVTFTVL